MSPTALNTAPHKQRPLHEYRQATGQGLRSASPVGMWFTTHSCTIPSNSCQILSKHQKPFEGREKLQNPDCLLNSRTAYIQCMRENGMKLRIKGHPSVYKSHTSKPQLRSKQHVWVFQQIISVHLWGQRVMLFLQKKPNRIWGSVPMFERCLMLFPKVCDHTKSLGLTFLCSGWVVAIFHEYDS